MKKNYFALFVFIFFLSSFSFGQIATKYYPDGFSPEKFQIKSKALKTMELPSFNLSVLQEGDKRNSGKGRPYRFGKGFDVNIQTNNKEEWEKIPEGYLWSMEFYSSGAKSINFVLENLNLSKGAELYVVNKQGTLVYGPVYHESNTKGRFLTDIIPGESVFLYIYDPSEIVGNSSITIKRVVHGYRGFEDAYGNPGASLGCNNDIACHSNWDLESDSVALVLLSNGEEWCSGSLLMSTDQSFRPYFLTAFHCIDINSSGVITNEEENDAEDWLFKFQFKHTTCSGSTVDWGITYNSATLRAAWANTDFALMELNNSPVGNDKISWAGWNRNPNPATSGTAIHHPRGDVMKISFDNDNLQSNAAPINWTGGLTSGVNTHWVVDFDNGTAEGGSSGSPIFDQNRRVVGQLHGGQNGCAPVTKYYGQFDNSWFGGGTNNTRLSNWLDPCGNGATTTNTSRSPFISGPSPLCSSGTYALNNVPTGATINWSVVPSTAASISGSGTSVTVTRNGSYTGSATITANVAANCQNFTVPKSISIGKAITMSWQGPGPYGQLDVSVYGGSSPYKFYKNGSLIHTSYSSPSVTIPFGCDGGVLKVEASTTCGTSSVSDIIPQGCASGPYSMMVYPNPATYEVYVTEASDANVQTNSAEIGNKKSAIKGEMILTLYDFSGMLMRGITLKAGEVKKINVTGLSKGHYFLRIIGKEIDEVHQIVIE